MKPCDRKEKERQDILRQMGSITRMRRGTVNEQFFKRDRKGSEPVVLGPYYLYSRTEKGVSFGKRLVTKEEVDRHREETENRRKFKDLSDRYVMVCEDLADKEQDAQKKNLAASFEAEVIAEIRALIGDVSIEALDFEAVEVAARHRALAIACKVVAECLNSDHSDHTGPYLPCSCGARAKYRGRRTKVVTTVLGEMPLCRAYYSCDICERGLFPRDKALDVSGSSLSPGVTRMVGHVGAMVSFQEGSDLLGELGGVFVDIKQVERIAEALGRKIAEDERAHVEPEVSDKAVLGTMYLGMDGTGIPMRAAELAGRSGKQPDGSAKSREVKLCTVWTADARDKDGRAVRDEGSVSYSAAIESAAMLDTDEKLSEFAERVSREAKRRGFDLAERRVILGDGAQWIWNLAGECFPDAIQIVDRFHVKEHIFELAKSIYGEANSFGKQWAGKRCDELDEGKIDALLTAIECHRVKHDKAGSCCNYIRKNRDRMRYSEFHAMGLCTSSGVVEAGCKVAIGTRLKRAGMHWSLCGANAIIALRCLRLSGRYEDFWARRHEARIAA